MTRYAGRLPDIIWGDMHVVVVWKDSAASTTVLSGSAISENLICPRRVSYGFKVWDSDLDMPFILTDLVQVMSSLPHQSRRLHDLMQDYGCGNTLGTASYTARNPKTRRARDDVLTSGNRVFYGAVIERRLRLSHLGVLARAAAPKRFRLFFGEGYAEAGVAATQHIDFPRNLWIRFDWSEKNTAWWLLDHGFWLDTTYGFPANRTFVQLAGWTSTDSSGRRDSVEKTGMDGKASSGDGECGVDLYRLGDDSSTYNEMLQTELITLLMLRIRSRKSKMRYRLRSNHEISGSRVLTERMGLAQTVEHAAVGCQNSHALTRHIGFPQTVEPRGNALAAHPKLDMTYQSPSTQVLTQRMGLVQTVERTTVRGQYTLSRTRRINFAQTVKRWTDLRFNVYHTLTPTRPIAFSHNMNISTVLRFILRLHTSHEPRITCENYPRGFCVRFGTLQLL
ncbi:hypothetical protein CVT25_010638 [Psilocybe cyanescens]|uniref:Uncharacterized protein n=1 Tax=Psilocybe cyanescens TaxID=93625 RepID=A0A409XWK9_PSICY|nr:hypothetical protein CVT25_010638 [Psilocybe cyanescens]